MVRYIALLRGINVGGYRPVKMEELRSMFRSMNFQGVKTYIQSGNVIFDGPMQDELKLGGQISIKVKEVFGYDLPVIIRRAEAMEHALNNFPFKEKGKWKGYMSFLPGQTDSQLVQQLEAQSNSIERFKSEKRLVYSLVYKGSESKSRFSNAFLENHLDMPATTRNIRTIQKLCKMARK